MAQADRALSTRADARPSSPHIKKVSARKRQRRRAVDAKLRARIESTVQRMIDALDAFDSLAEDLEDDDPAAYC